jgi:hypothetical protein
MIYELRTYQMVPELFEEYLVRANNILIPIIIDQIGFRVVGFWTGVSEANESFPAGEETQIPKIPAQVVWMTAWESLEERAVKWDELHANEDWQREFDGKYYLGAHVKFIQPMLASPLQ